MVQSHIDENGHAWWWQLPALAIWAAAWTFLFVFDERVDLANKALLLVLTAAIASLWSSPWLSVAASATAVLGFNFSFVPPVGSFAVDLQQHALLLATILSVSCIVALLVSRLRWHAARATDHAMRADQLRRLGDGLRAADDEAQRLVVFRDALAHSGCAVQALLLEPDETSAADSLVGSATVDEAAGLRLCRVEGRAMGPGTGRYTEQSAWYLPVRGKRDTRGAALVRVVRDPHRDGLLEHVQAVCDQLGAAIVHIEALKAASTAREQANAHALRNTLLAAISHDHRTPLATILGAAGSLHDQADHLSTEQRRHLSATIVDEASQLARLTDNTLQLARLGSNELALRRDWESVEELVGTVLRRVRQRGKDQQIAARIEPGLPLLRCDAVLVVQMLDNLVDNALKYAGEQPVELVARRMDKRLVIAVRDRGPGVAPALRERIFESFQRGELPATDRTGSTRRGAGVGLALCRAISQTHGWTLQLRERRHGGASFEVFVPCEASPEVPG